MIWDRQKKTKKTGAGLHPHRLSTRYDNGMTF